MNRNSVSEKRYQQRNEGSILPLMLFFPTTLFYSELVTRLSTYSELQFKQLIYILLFSVSGGMLVSCVLSLIKDKTAVKMVSIILSIAIMIVCAAHVVYFNIFGNYFSWENFGMAGDAMADFKDMLFRGICDSIVPIVFLMLPLIVFIVMRRRMTFYRLKSIGAIIPLSACAVASALFVVAGLIIQANHGYESDLYFYNHPTEKETALKFGVLTSSRLNIHRIIFGEVKDNYPITPIDSIVPPPAPPITDNSDNTSGKSDTTDNPPIPVEYGDNVMDIDFDTLINNAPDATIKAMHEYFKNVRPTKQNEYTGYFKGKNLIFMTLEGFSGRVIDKELTPTLYKMVNGGFVFNNYYCSCWGGSTATGEYANMTGNFYNKASCLKTSGSTYQPFTLGNQLKSMGYNTYAFHGHTYTYYSRNLSHPNFGYQYMGIGNGLENLTDVDGKKMTIRWPNSDYEVARVTIGQYIDKQPFHTYYMSISGHANYNWGGNKMCAKHKSEVQNLPYSEEVKAYFACQLEVEAMLTELVNQLDAAGILENTVFVMAADHYPFGLSEGALKELYGIKDGYIYGDFDLYRNSLIIWSASMEKPVVVDTPCSAIDILPTVSNLFGIEYDSRLMMGTDVFSDQEPIVILNCDEKGPGWNWINKYGEYNSSKGFTAASGYDASSDEMKQYVKSINSLVIAKKKMSFQILTKDYYSYVFGKK